MTFLWENMDKKNEIDHCFEKIIFLLKTSIKYNSYVLERSKVETGNKCDTWYTLTKFVHVAEKIEEGKMKILISY